jgi:hypothetical protein
VADQLSHGSPELTLRTYAHALPVSEDDLAFADIGAAKNVAKRRYASPHSEDDPTNENAPDLTSRGHYENLERETGIEPATLSLGS